MESHSDPTPPDQGDERRALLDALMNNKPLTTMQRSTLYELLSAAQPVAQEAIPEGCEKMRGGKPVAFWRDDALEAAAGIVEAYGANPQIAIDIRAMKSPVKSAIRDWLRGYSPATGSES